MDLLLVKPAIWRNRKRVEVVENFQLNGATVLNGETEHDIRNQVSQCLEHDSNVRVIACGGDGTVHRLLNSTIGLDVAMAVVPLGTGNDFARFIGLRNSDQAVAALLGNTQRNIDIGRVTVSDGTVRHFAGVASCGFDAQVNERANHLRGPEGAAKYLAAVLGELRDLVAHEWELSLDGQSFRNRYSLVAVGNTSSYGGGMKICPDALADDGLFNLTIVEEVNRRTLIRVLPRVFSGNHIHHHKVITKHARTVRFAGESFPVYADGERIGQGPATLEIIPSAMRVVVAR